MSKVKIPLDDRQSLVGRAKAELEGKSQNYNIQKGEYGRKGCDGIKL